MHKEMMNRRVTRESATMVAARPRTEVDHRMLVDDGPPAGTPLSTILRRDGALQIGATVLIVRALIEQIGAAHAARGGHGALSTESLFLHEEHGRLQLSAEGLTTATRSLSRAEVSKDIEAIGDVLIKCLLGLTASAEAVERAIDAAPRRASMLLEVGVEALGGRIESLEDLAARFDAWESTFGETSRRAQESGRSTAPTSAA